MFFLVTPDSELQAPDWSLSLTFAALQRSPMDKKQINVTMSNRTFTMIKPDAMKNGHAGAILHHISKAGFKIKALKMLQLSAEKAGVFYAIHKERPFYGELVAFMSSGPI